MNRLAGAMSPYLRQHADNPVDWWPWSDEAFAQARERDVPVMISVGYSACHWCHVMADESFDDDTVAEALNADFVSIKVDREERPDVDAVYMAATQAMTGQGGWPMTVFATPDGEPFFCGTYFPKPQFLRLLQAVSDAWRHRRDELIAQGSTVAQALTQMSQPPGASTPLDAAALDAAAAQLAAEHDQVRGGFGTAPKFPPHMNLLFLLRHHDRTGAARSREIAWHTCEQMARGGIYDQLAGGFARYSVDATWTVPHFEKMLYDNALLLRVYTRLWRDAPGVDGRGGLAGRVARETAEFLLQDMLLSTGGFASALDADTEGVEGATYVWTPAQLREVLGDDDGAWAADLFHVTDEGTFEHGASVLRLARDLDDPGIDQATVRRWASVRQRLADARARRPQPARDEKVVAAWNGLAVTALCEHLAVTHALAAAGGDPQRDERLQQLRRHIVDTAELLVRHIVDGRLYRVSRDGDVGDADGVLEDYGAVAEAFCAVHQLTGEGRFLQLAGELLDSARSRFGRDDGGFYDTAADAEQLIARPADPSDNATPSGLSAMAAALTAYSALAGSPQHRQAAQEALATVAPIVARHARFTGYACATGEALLSGPYEIAVATDDPANDPLVHAAVRHAPPGAVVVAGAPDQPGVPLLAGRPRINGRAAAYVCRGFVCDRPVTDVEALVGQLASV